jgi:hypothetical protein
VLHRVARQRLFELADTTAWAAANARAAELGITKVIAEVAATIDGLLDR